MESFMFDPASPQILAQARIVLPDGVIENGWIAMADGIIQETGEGRPPERAQDCRGDTVIPGLVELHTDHLESHYAPRPKVRWNALPAVIAYDAQIASSGITTVFDSLRVGSDSDSASLGSDLWTLAEAVATARDTDAFRIEHRTHLRCELCAEDVIELAEGFLARYPAHLISLMDHTPGQRQFTSLATWKNFYSRRSVHTDTELDAFIAKRLEARSRFGEEHRRRLVAIAHRSQIVLASHDDADRSHVTESVGDGVRIAEFPTTLEAAEASHEAGIAVMMGAPNLVRGGSHSGNVAAEELAREGLLDMLSSDYVPSSLLQAAFDLPRRVQGLSLPAAIRTVTQAPAEATGLCDRGAIVPGLKADLVRVGFLQDTPYAREVYKDGRRVA